MEVHVEQLIDRIKAEGVETAKAESSRIVQEAEEAARHKLREAEHHAESIRADARADADRFQASAEAAVRQAARDLLLQVEDQLRRMLDAVTREQLDQALVGETLAKAVITLLQNWTPDGSDSIAVLVPEDQLPAVEKAVRAALSAKLRDGVSIQPVSGISAGFQVREKDGSAYYDFSTAGIAEIMGAFLNARLSESVRAAAKND